MVSGVGTLTANAGTYNGTGSNNLLVAASSNLTVGAVGQITFGVVFDPNGLPGPFNNQATATGLSPQSTTVTDLSDNALDPDPNGNGDPDEPGENDPTPVGVPQDAGDRRGQAGQRRGGLERQRHLHRGLPPAGREPRQRRPHQRAGGRQPDRHLPGPGLDHRGHPAGHLDDQRHRRADRQRRLQRQRQHQPAGRRLEQPDGRRGRPDRLLGHLRPQRPARPFNNQATASGVSPLGTNTTDISDNGLDPDPDGDGNPNEPGENDPTPVAIAETPVIGVAKRVNGPVADNGNGTFTVNFVLVVENLGNVDLNNVVGGRRPAGDLPGPGVDHRGQRAHRLDPDRHRQPRRQRRLTPAHGNNNLLQFTSTLDVGSTGQISFAVTFDPNGQTGPFNNQALASGQSPGDVTVDDLSDDGADPDPDGDGNPDEPGENDPTPVTRADHLEQRHRRRQRRGRPHRQRRRHLHRHHRAAWSKTSATWPSRACRSSDDLAAHLPGPGRGGGRHPAGRQHDLPAAAR